MTRYTYAATLTWEHDDPEADDPDIDTTEMEVEVSYSVDPGYPESGPSYSSGGEPGQPAMVEDIEVVAVDGTPFAEWAATLPFGLSHRIAGYAISEKLLDEREHEMLEEAADDDAARRDDYLEGLAEERRWEREHDQPLWIEGDD